MKDEHEAPAPASASGRGAASEVTAEPKEPEPVADDDSAAKPVEPADDDGDSGGGDSDDASGEEKPKKARKRGSFWRELPVLIVIALVLALVIKTWLIQAFFIPSASMENTLKINDRVLVNKFVYHTRDVRRGDIVVFNGLDSWDPESEFGRPKNPVSKALNAIGVAFGMSPNEKDYVKRVIGVPGDHVRCCDAQGRITVNGHPLDEKAYLYPGNAPSDTPFDETVPEGQLWVMGDHREVSSDSRSHLGDPGGGTIPENKVIGRAFARVWPPSRIGGLPIPRTFTSAAGAVAGGAAPAAPLVLGTVGAVPLTWLQRRVRTRVRR